jgi:hypothetical protein
MDGQCGCGWLIHDALKCELESLNDDRSYRGDVRENYMIDKTNGVKVPLKLERTGAR